MKKYIRSVQSKTPHERRQHALQAATVFTAGVFVVWITTLGLRLTNSGVVAAQNQDGGNQTQLAGAASSYVQGANNTLEVATSSDQGAGSGGLTLPYAQ